MPLEVAFVARDFPAVDSESSSSRRRHVDAEGYAAGYAAGMQAARRELLEQSGRLEAEAIAVRAAEAARLDAAVDALRLAVGAAERCAIPVLTDAREFLADAAIALAEAILAREVPDAAAAVTVAIERIDSHFDAADVVAVRMNPYDLRELEARGALAAPHPLVADATLEPGDVVAEFADGFLEAGIGSALARARAALTFGSDPS